MLISGSSFALEQCIGCFCGTVIDIHGKNKRAKVYFGFWFQRVPVHPGREGKAKQVAEAVHTMAVQKAQTRS